MNGSGRLSSNTEEGNGAKACRGTALGSEEAWRDWAGRDDGSSGHWRCCGCRPGVVAQAAVRFGADFGPTAEPSPWLATVPIVAASLLPVAPCGLPLALGCRRLYRLGYRRGAWVAGIVLGAVTVAASVVAGLLGPVAIAFFAVVLSVPVWVAWYWLVRRG